MNPSFLNLSYSLKKEWVEARWWMWTGGLLGAFYVLATTIFLPRFVTASTVGLLLSDK
ncbi:DMT family transporter (plasmid) [Niallia taxi]|uniref:DMT family transporter n=1 Tax=Niallia taxi TaxID=2499688 RepID=UPI0022A7C598|nr:DMT family transporter [Niallia taxi]